MPNEEDAQLLNDCIDGKSFAWEKFVDRFLPAVLKVVDFAATESKVKLTDEQRNHAASSVFAELAADDFQQLRNFDGQSSASTYVSIVAQRSVTGLLNSARSESSQAAKESQS